MAGWTQHIAIIQHSHLVCDAKHTDYSQLTDGDSFPDEAEKYSQEETFDVSSDMSEKPCSDFKGLEIVQVTASRYLPIFGLSTTSPSIHTETMHCQETMVAAG